MARLVKGSRADLIVESAGPASLEPQRSAILYELLQEARSENTLTENKMGIKLMEIHL